MRRYLPTALLTIIVLTVLAACNGDGSTPATPTSDTIQPPPGATVLESTSTPTDSAATSTPITFEGSRDPVEVSVGTLLQTPLLADVRAARHEGFDRVVFDFAVTSRPGYRVEYVTAPIQQCGSGNQETIAGSAFIQVRMTPAAAHDDAGQPTFGTNELLPGLPTLLEVQQTCDFEGIVTWVLGLSEEVDFVVSALADPFRVVVDVAHPSN